MAFLQFLGYSAIRGGKNPKTKIPRGAPTPRSKPSSAPLHHIQLVAALPVQPCMFASLAGFYWGTLADPAIPAKLSYKQ